MAVKATDNSVDITPCKVSIKLCMLACRKWCGFGRCWASCRWICANPHLFPWHSQRGHNSAVSSVFPKRSKHIAIKLHWVREHVDPDGECGIATLIHVRTKDPTADIFIKSLTDQDFCCLL